MDSLNLANKASLNQRQRMANIQQKVLSDGDGLDRKKQMALNVFAQALSDHRTHNAVDMALYGALVEAFKRIVQSIRFNNHSYGQVRKAAANLAYYEACEDPIFGLSHDSVQAHTQQIMADNDVRPVTLPQGSDEVTRILNDAINAALG